MRRWIWLLICAILGLVMLVCGLLVPVHLRAVDVNVIQDAGRQTPGLVRRGLGLAEENNLGAARLLWQAAEMERLPDREQLGLAVTNLAAQRSGWRTLGSPNPRLEKLAAHPAGRPAGEKPGLMPTPTASATPPNRSPSSLVPTEIHDWGLGLLGNSLNPALQELLRCRNLTNTAIFRPPLPLPARFSDTALLVCGLLLEEKKLNPALSNAVYELAWAANHGGHALPGLGRRPSGPSWNSGPSGTGAARLDVPWPAVQLGRAEVFARSNPGCRGPARVAFLVRKFDAQVPVLFAATLLSGQPGAVAGYGVKFGEDGLADLGSVLQFGAGGVELLLRNQRCYSGASRAAACSLCPFWRPAAGRIRLLPAHALVCPRRQMVSLSGQRLVLVLQKGSLTTCRGFPGLSLRVLKGTVPLSLRGLSPFAHSPAAAARPEKPVV